MLFWNKQIRLFEWASLDFDSPKHIRFKPEIVFLMPLFVNFGKMTRFCNYPRYSGIEQIRIQLTDLLGSKPERAREAACIRDWEFVQLS